MEVTQENPHPLATLESRRKLIMNLSLQLPQEGKMQLIMFMQTETYTPTQEQIDNAKDQTQKIDFIELIAWHPVHGNVAWNFFPGIGSILISARGDEMDFFVDAFGGEGSEERVLYLNGIIQTQWPGAQPYSAGKN